MPDTSFYWQDYEPFGRVPRGDRLAQFAGLRNDADLNEVSEPLMLHCQPADDFLPDPESVPRTGILPHRRRLRGDDSRRAAVRSGSLA